MKYYIFSRRRVEVSLPKERHIVLSFRDPKSPVPKYARNKNTLGILQQEFDDIEQFMNILTPFSIDQAEAIINFVKEHLDDVDAIVAHCEAGISRSAGAISALSLLIDRYEYRQRNTFPNTRVKTMIGTAAILEGWDPFKEREDTDDSN